MDITITAQFLYDLRTFTGFISGTELHDLFRQLLGNPSPSGRVNLTLKEAMRLSPALKQLLNTSLRQIAAQAAEYTGAPVASQRLVGLTTHAYTLGGALCAEGRENVENKLAEIMAAAEKEH